MLRPDSGCVGQTPKRARRRGRFPQPRQNVTHRFRSDPFAFLPERVPRPAWFQQERLALDIVVQQPHRTSASPVAQGSRFVFRLVRRKVDLDHDVRPRCSRCGSDVGDLAPIRRTQTELPSVGTFVHELREPFEPFPASLFRAQPPQPLRDVDLRFASPRSFTLQCSRSKDPPAADRNASEHKETGRTNDAVIAPLNGQWGI
jgi:hypothetical protein